jgi:hypothetical protein
MAEILSYDPAGDPEVVGAMEADQAEKKVKLLNLKLRNSSKNLLSILHRSKLLVKLQKSSTQKVN